MRNNLVSLLLLSVLISPVSTRAAEKPAANVLGDKDGKRTLTFRDAQHEYVFTEFESAEPSTQ